MTSPANAIVVPLSGFHDDVVGGVVPTTESGIERLI